MLNSSNLTDNDIGFFILSPADSDIPGELLENLDAPGKDESIHIFKSDWLVYQPADKDDAYSWQIPGIKLFFKNQTDFDKAKSIADQILSELKDKTQLRLDLVIIDKTRLKDFS